MAREEREREAAVRCDVMPSRSIGRTFFVVCAHVCAHVYACCVVTLHAGTQECVEGKYMPDVPSGREASSACMFQESVCVCVLMCMSRTGCHTTALFGQRRFQQENVCVSV